MGIKISEPTPLTKEQDLEVTDEAYLEADNLFQNSLNPETGNLLVDGLVYEIAKVLTARDKAIKQERSRVVDYLKEIYSCTKGKFCSAHKTHDLLKALENNES